MTSGRSMCLRQPSIFISYAPADLDYVQTLADFLRRADVPVFFDLEVATDSRWRTTRAPAIDDCAAVLVVESSAARQSKWVEREVHYALSRGRDLFSVVLDGEPRFGIDRSRIEHVLRKGFPDIRLVQKLSSLVSQRFNDNMPLAGMRQNAVVHDWSPPPPPSNSVHRPDALTSMLDLLWAPRRNSDNPIAFAITGPVGAGKSVLLASLVADPGVTETFPGGSIWLRLGAFSRRLRLRSHLDRLCRELGDVPRPDEDVHTQLCRNLSQRPPTLLVLDDVRSAAQVAPFVGSDLGDTRILVTTRYPALLPSITPTIRIDFLEEWQCRSILSTGIAQPLSRATVDRALGITHRRPLALDLLNRALQFVSNEGRDPEEFVSAAHGNPSLQHVRPDDLATFVGAMVDATLGHRHAHPSRRLIDLGILAENASVDHDLVASLWSRTGGQNGTEADRLVADLAALGLIWSWSYDIRRMISVPNTLRELLSAQLNRDSGYSAHATLLTVIAVHDGLLAPKDRLPSRFFAWWRLPTQAGYARRHLIHHLLAAGWADEARRLVRHPRWLSDQLQLFGTAAVSADLAAVGDPDNARLRCLLDSASTMLAPVIPAHSQADIVAAQFGNDDEFRADLTVLDKSLPSGFVRLRLAWDESRSTREALRAVFASHLSAVNDVAVDATGRWIATAGDDHTAQLWDRVSGAPGGSLEGHRAAVTAIAWLPDGSQWVTASRDSTVRVWNAESGVCTMSLAGHRGWVLAVTASPDGTCIASGGIDATVRIWDVRTGRERATLTGHTDSVRALAFAPGGNLLASVGDDRTVRLWNPATGELLGSFDGHHDTVRTVAFFPDGRRLVSAGDDAHVRVWDAATGQSLVALIGHTDRVTAVAVAPDGSWLAGSSLDEIRVWSADGVLRGTLGGRTGIVRAMTVLPDTSWLVTVGDDGQARAWEVDAFPPPGASPRRDRPIGVVAPAGGWLAVGGDDGLVQLIRAADGQAIRTLAGHRGAVSALAISPEQDWIASASDDQTIRVWDAATGATRFELAGHTDGVGGLAVAPDGSWLASGGDDRTVRIWNPETGEAPLVLSGHTARVNSVAIAPDGKWFISTSDDGTVRVWDALTGSALAVLTGHAGWVRGAAISPDGTWFASAGGDGTVRLWDAATLTERAVIEGHDGAVSWVSIAPDGMYLATAGGDATVRLWDPVTGTNVATARVAGPLLGVDWAPDGTAVFAVGEFGPYRFDVFDTGVLDRIQPGVVNQASTEDGPGR